MTRERRCGADWSLRGYGGPYSPHFASRLTATGCVLCSWPHLLARSCSLGDHFCRTERPGVRQPHDKGRCQRKHYEEGVRGGKGLWHPIIMVLSYLWLPSQFFTLICVHHTLESRSGSTEMYLTQTRLESSISERPDFPSITGWHVGINTHDHFLSPKIIFSAIKEVAFVAQSRWEALWETDGSCFKGNLKCALKNINKVINKPNYSKFRRMTDNTDWETEVWMAAETHATVCPLHQRP